MNALLITGDKFGTSMLYGNGAGGDATASAVVTNLVEAINFSSGKDLRNKNIFKSSGEKVRLILEKMKILSALFISEFMHVIYLV